MYKMQSYLYAIPLCTLAYVALTIMVEATDTVYYRPRRLFSFVLTESRIHGEKEIFAGGDKRRKKMWYSQNGKMCHLSYVLCDVRRI